MGSAGDCHGVKAGRAAREDGPRVILLLEVGRVVGVRGRRSDGTPVLTLVRVENVWENNPHEDAIGSTVAEVPPISGCERE